MRRILLLSVLMLMPTLLHAQAQNFGGGGLAYVAALPGTCTPGVTASVQLSVAAFTINYCSAVNTWTALGGAGAAAFNLITGGTNAAAAMVVGTGASLTISGSGTINATTLNGTTFASPAAIGTGTPAAGHFSTLDATGGITSTADGVHAGNVALVGNTTVVTPAANTANIMGPSSAAFTAYAYQMSATGPAAACIPHAGAPSSAVSQLTCTALVAADMPAQYTKWLACDGKGVGDGLNAIPAGTYLQSTCKNITGVTVTITGLQCYTDGGSSTLNAAGNTLGALLTGAVTCTNAYAAGTQSANVLLTANDYIKFTFVADGTAKQTDWVVTGTY